MHPKAIRGFASGWFFECSELTLQIVLDRAGASTASVHRLLQGWIEGTGSGFSAGSPENFGSPAQAGEPTWNSRASPSTPWGTAGGLAGTDFVAAASATTNAVSSKLTCSSAGLTADDQPPPDDLVRLEPKRPAVNKLKAKPAGRPRRRFSAVQLLSAQL